MYGLREVFSVFTQLMGTGARLAFETASDDSNRRAIVEVLRNALTRARQQDMSLESQRRLVRLFIEAAGQVAAELEER